MMEMCCGERHERDVNDSATNFIKENMEGNVSDKYRKLNTKDTEKDVNDSVVNFMMGRRSEEESEDSVCEFGKAGLTQRGADEPKSPRPDSGSTVLLPYHLYCI